MKNRFKLIFLLITATLFLYILYLKSSSSVNIKDINKKEVIYLRKSKHQETVYGFSVKIIGKIEGVAKVTLRQSSPKGNLHRKQIINGNVDINWGGDWYTDTIVIIYEPVGVVKSGKLKIDYEFNGL